jgi:hypothetical protein
VEAEELQKGLFGTARASALAAVDPRYNHNALIVADLSNDASYADVLLETFGSRVIGMQISRHGDGTDAERRQCNRGNLSVYTVGRSYLIELLHREMQADLVRIIHGPGTSKAFDQLVKLDVEYREGGVVYSCPSGNHDDLGISMAMLAWAAGHPHLPYWVRNHEAARRPRRPREKQSWGPWT